MAKALVACFNRKHNRDLNTFANRLCKRLTPDNAYTTKPYIYLSDYSISIIYNPTKTVRHEGSSICLGITDNNFNLFEIGHLFPNGSYALFKLTRDEVEVGSDAAASRTMWYFFDKNSFIISTSQRMIIALLGNLNYNEKAGGWFLSTGTLGPGYSWDMRLRMIPPGTTLKLNRRTWILSTCSRNSIYKFNSQEIKGSDFNLHKRIFKKSVEESVSSLKINPENWTLALSGGMDSRSLLFYLKDVNLKAVTWGIESALNDPLSDAYIAKELASYCGMDHHYAIMNFQNGSFPSLLDRFICAGEGRIDHLAGYLDGLSLWGCLSGSGRGVIRGYDTFGRKPQVSNPYQVRRNSNLHLTTDYTDYKQFPLELQTTERDVPTKLRRNIDESLEDWRDRLWLQHRTPIITAALEDIKLAYVEVINPLLSGTIIETLQAIPTALRTNKRIWKSIVSDMFPNIPIASKEAVAEVLEILNIQEVETYICDSLDSLSEIGIIPKPFISQIIENYGKNKNKQALRRFMRKIIIAYFPKQLENFVRSKITPDPLNYQYLALRCLMILKTYQMLQEDIKYTK